MKKSGVVIVVIIIALVIGLVLITNVNRNKVVDWRESFNEKSNKPYGVSVLYKELPKLFKDKKIRTVYYYPETYLDANSEDGNGDHTAEGTYFIIGNSDYLEADDVDELLAFTGNGNTLFISDYNFPVELLENLDLEIDYITNKDSISKLSFNYNRLTEKNTAIDRSVDASYFSKYEGNYNSLGYLNNDNTLINFLEIPYNDGKIYLHLEPKIFTNYNILKEDRYKYVEGTLSFLPDENIYFDSYTHYYNAYNNTEKESELGWFLEQQAFRWAWYLALLLTLLFMIFNAKRRQRIIQIIKPLQNTTVAFVKTISSLYFDSQDYKNLIHKKITYFLEKIRTDYNLDTSTLDDEFITRLASKSGKKKEEIKKLIDFINWLRTKNEFFEDNLLKLNKHIEDFYSK